ncbi:MAG: flagellar hook-basal body complex protein, partial [Desulfobacterales bacterium]
MSLTSSLYSGISGLSTLGNSMQIIGDNIANVNTVAFKGSNYTFQDLLSQSVATQSGTSQVGRGTALGDISANFQQGSFESTGNTTDLAIGGKGFFVLREDTSNSQFYTRAGNFSFNNDGYLTSPEGYVVQGWALDEDTGEDMGSIADIMLTSFTSPPRQTDEITVITNLDADTISNTLTLEDAWDAANAPPMAATSYEYQSTVKAYDSLGSTHDITIYYDIIDGSSNWEYVVTCNPTEDRRAFIGAGDPSAGLLARGQIDFSASSGNITNLTLDNLTAGGAVAARGWTAAALNPDGYYEFAADFLGGVPLSVDLNIGSRHDGTG